MFPPTRRRISKPEMYKLLKVYAEKEFGPVMQRISSEKMGPFLDALNSVIHSHRFKKGDEYTEGIDFSLI